MPVEILLRHSREFEQAAFWYLHLEPHPLGGKASALRAEAEKIGKQAKRLLKALGIEDVRQAPDGPAPRILELLTYGESAQESLIIDATKRIGRLAEICNAVAATREITSHAEKASPGIQQLANAMGLTGHTGDQALELWLGSMMAVYSRITGSRPKMNVGASGRPDQGKASGMFLEFLAAAGAPLGIKLSLDALRGRARAVLKHPAAKK
jgi:hypothetical protein